MWGESNSNNAAESNSLKAAKTRSTQLKSSNYSLKESLVETDLNDFTKVVKKSSNGTLKITSRAKSLVKNIANSGYLPKVEGACDSLEGLIESDYKNALVIGPFVMKLLGDVLTKSQSDLTRFKDSLDLAKFKLSSLKVAIESAYTTLPNRDDAELSPPPPEFTSLENAIKNNFKLLPLGVDKYFI